MTQQLINLGTLPNDGTGDPIQTGGTKINANFSELYSYPISKVPTTITAATGTVSATDAAIIANFAGTVTLTLPAAATFPGRGMRIKTLTNNLVVSATANIVPLLGGAASTSILAATAGKWAELISDGTNWIIMESN